MSFAKVKVSSIDRGVLDLISKDEFSTPEVMAKVLKVSVQEVKDAVARLRENDMIKYKPVKIADDKTPKYELTDKGGDVLKEQPAKTDKIKVVYRYDLAANAPKLLGGKSREFCADLMALNRVYTRDDINAMSEREGRNVWSLRGGWYHNPNTGVNEPQCRHTWRQVVVREKE